MATPLFPGNPDGVRNAVRVLSLGGIVGIPTETVYGLGGLVSQPTACERIFAAKGRPKADPLILHCHSVAQAKTYGTWSAAAQQLADAFWPGPLTIILRRTDLVPDIVTAGRTTVALRVPAHPLCLALLRALEAPLAAPSANPFGYISPTSAEHVLASLGGRIDGVLDGGPCAYGLESTIVDVSNSDDTPCVLRPGGVGLETIQEVLPGTYARRVSVAESGQAALSAPGTFTRHYSPAKPTRLFTDPAMLDAIAVCDAAVIFLSEAERTVFAQTAAGARHPTAIWSLSQSGDFHEIAANLYRVMREADESQAKVVCIQKPTEASGIAIAIRDRMNRAANACGCSEAP